MYYTGTERTVTNDLPFGRSFVYGYFGSMMSVIRLDTISSGPAHHFIALAAHSRTVSKLAPRYIMGTALGCDCISADSSEATDAR